MPKRLGSLVLAVALGFTVVACGGDDKTATEETTTTAGSNDDTDLAAFTKECAELTQVFAGAYASIGAGLGGAAGN
ncbi:MAG: ABC transporter substrate-binding protein, partial [Microthrixaceae bacterium]